MAVKKQTVQDCAENEKKYVEFLQKRLNSTNYKDSVSAEEYAKTKQKYDKAKLLLKLLSK